MKKHNLEYVKQLVSQPDKCWREILIGNYTLLQEAIVNNRKKIFKYLLDFCDVEYLDTWDMDRQTAFSLAAKYDAPDRSCFVSDLKKKFGAKLLHSASFRLDVNAARDLLEKGVDPNVRSKDGLTPLHRAIWYSSSKIAYEFVALLLFYGADPLLEYKTCNAFESAVYWGHHSRTQEILFEYTFDKLSSYQIYFTVLVDLGRSRSPLFHRMLELDVEFFSQDMPLTAACVNKSIRFLFQLDLDFLQIVLEKCYRNVCEIYENFTITVYSRTGYEIFTPLNIQMFVKSMMLIAESGPEMGRNVAYHMSTIPTRWEFLCLIIELEKEEATEMLIFLVQYGLDFPRQTLDFVYKTHGYCELFKFLLHVDYAPCIIPFDHRSISRDDVLIVGLIRETHKDLNFLFMRHFSFYSETKLLDILDFCAHRKLQRYLLEKIEAQRLEVSERDLQRLREHPEIPSLLELSRNMFRKHLIQRFEVKTTSMFYSLVNNLNVYPDCKKIICFEKKIYRNI